MPANRVELCLSHAQHCDPYSCQNRSLKYLSAPSHNTVTITAFSLLSAHSVCDSLRSRHSSGGRDANHQALLARQSPRHLIGSFCLDFHFAVGKVRIVNSRHHGGLHMLQTFQTVEWRIRLQRNTLDAADSIPSDDA